MYCYYLHGSVFLIIFFFKQKTAYEMRISDWSSDVCSSDLSTKHRSKAVVQGRRSPVRCLKGASGRVDAVSRGRREIVRRRPDRSTIRALLFPRHFFLRVVERFP